MPIFIKCIKSSPHPVCGNNAGFPFDLMLFDNGSCEEVQQYFLDEFNTGNIEYLLLSQKNLGKGGAWNLLFGGAPGEIIAYTDNDVLFSKNWLKESVSLLGDFSECWHGHCKTFPHQSGVLQFNHKMGG